METQTIYQTVANEQGDRFRAIGAEVQGRRMAKSYRVTDPVALAEKLRAGGFDVDITSRGRARKFTVGGTPWRAIVVARDPVFDGEYRKEVSFLCAHDGRTAFAVRPGVQRQGCLNQFTLAPVRLHHCDSDLDRVLQDPAGMARSVLNLATLARERVEGLMDVGNAFDMLNAIRGAKRLHKRALNAFCRYWGHGFWSVLQAFTHTKSPTLVELTSRAIDDGYGDTKEGRVPFKAWAPILARFN